MHMVSAGSTCEWSDDVTNGGNIGRSVYSHRRVDAKAYVEVQSQPATYRRKQPVTATSSKLQPQATGYSHKQPVTATSNQSQPPTASYSHHPQITSTTYNLLPYTSTSPHHPQTTPTHNPYLTQKTNYHQQHKITDNTRS